MRGIKVYLQKPFGILDSSYYKYLREGVPDNVEYVEKGEAGLVGVGKFGKSFWLKQFIKKILRFFNLSFVNVYYSNVEGVDVIHCVNCMSKNRGPWIADLEHVGHFWWGSCAKCKVKIIDGKFIKNFNVRAKDKVREYLCSGYCKKIIAWSEWTKNNIIREFPEIKNKIEVVYPAIKPQKKAKRKSRKFRILFVGRDFGIKGGEVALRVINELMKKYSNVEGVMVSDVPNKFLDLYSGNKRIRFVGLVPKDELFEKFYPFADIFLYPTFSDTFGFAILEAKSFGLPVVAMRTMSTHTIDETVSDRVNGFVVDNLGINGFHGKFDDSIVDRFVEAVEKLIGDKKLLKKMSRASFRDVVNGKFSIVVRNKKLGRIYRVAAGALR